MSATEDARRLIPAAMDRFGARVHTVPPDRWDPPTPCSEWTVRDLVAHMCFEHRWAPHILAGEAMEEVGDRYHGDFLSGEPVRGWDLARGAGLDERVDPECVDEALAYLRGDPVMLHGPGLADAVEPSSSDPLNQLVALTGRSASS